MSRIRTVKPDFWTSEQVISCSPLARLAFIGLWNFCDDNGVHPASYVRLKAEIFPGDACTIDEVKCWIDELINNDLLREYSVKEKSYWIVTGWKTHQRIEKPTYRHPLPQSELKKIGDNSTSNRQVLDDNSPTPPRLVDNSSVTEWIVKDRIEKEEDIREVDTSLIDVSQSKSSTAVIEIFKYWQEVMNHPHAKLDEKRKRRINDALTLGYSIKELKTAIDGCASTPFNLGDNERHQRYDDLELILRDAARIDRFMANAANPPLASEVSASQSNTMMGVM